jgi:hypothetical protein
MKMKEWCELGDGRPTFGAISSGFLTEMLGIVTEYVDKWIYFVIIGAPMSFILWSLGEAEDKQVEDWSRTVVPMMCVLSFN